VNVLSVIWYLASGVAAVAAGWAVGGLLLAERPAGSVA
jgi:hypothetical protein